jgi:methionyl-tRNA formyltransferase
LRTVYLGTSEFAAAVLERLAASAHRPVLVVTRPDAPQGRGRRLAAPPVAVRAMKLKLDVVQPEDLHAADMLDRIAAARPDVICVCAYGALIREPLLSDYEMLNVHPSLLPRWRGAAPIERAIMAGDAETGVSIMRVTAGLDSGPVCLNEAVPITREDDYGTLAARLEELGGDLLVRALDERPECVEQDSSAAIYAPKIEGRDRTLDFTRHPIEVERTVRALRPHIGARLPLPDGTWLGVIAARVPDPPIPTLAAAGGRVRVEGDQLLLDCNGGALELVEIRPPGGRPMAASAWLRGRPPAELTSFWLDPRLPERPLEELVELAVAEWGSKAEWAPHLAALAWRGSGEVLEAMGELSADRDPAARSVSAYVLGQLGVPARTQPGESARALERMADEEHHPEVLAAIAGAFGNLGEPHGTEWLLRLHRHPDASVRDAVADALAGRDDPRALEALISLSADPDARIRDLATFALGALAPADTPALRAALAERLDDDDPETAAEAMHGLALRGDERAVEPLLRRLGAGGGAGDPLWTRHALEEATIRLAALTGDARFAPYLPQDVERFAGTMLEEELRRARDRCGVVAARPLLSD